MADLKKNLLRAALAAPLVFLATEVSLRVLQPTALQYYRNVKLLHVYHPEYRAALPKHANIYVKHYQGLWEGRFTTNSMGFRGSPDPDPKKPQLACLGDSVVMGFGVSDHETFCSLLNGVQLRGERWQAMNLAVDAFGSMGSALRLREMAPRLNIKVALFFPSPNDFTMPEVLRARGVLSDDEKRAAREKNPGAEKLFEIQFKATRISYTLHALKLAIAQIRLRRTETLNAMRAELLEAGILKEKKKQRKSFGCYMLRSFYRKWARRACDSKPVRSGESPTGQTARTGTTTQPTTKSPDFCPRPLLPGTRCSKNPPTRLEPLLDVTRRAYDLMVATAKKNNVRLLVVLLPIQNEVLQCTQNGQYSRYFNFGLRATKYFRSRGVEVVDLRPHVHLLCGEQIPDGKGKTRPSVIADYFIPGDGHFTVLGNRWAARIIRKELKRRVR